MKTKLYQNFRLVKKLIFNLKSENIRHITTTNFYCAGNLNSNWGSKKSHRNIKLQLLNLREMADPKIEEILAPLREHVKEQVSQFCESIL